ncbi:MAG: DUF378 domain-containing protein [Candidatus Amoebophilus sp.]
MTTKKYIRIAAVILTIIGALNWGLVGLAKFDLVAYLFGSLTNASRIVYSLVGLSGFYILSSIKRFV